LIFRTYIFIFGQNVLPPKLTELLHLWFKLRLDVWCRTNLVHWKKTGVKNQQVTIINAHQK